VLDTARWGRLLVTTEREMVSQKWSDEDKTTVTADADQGSSLKDGCNKTT